MSLCAVFRSASSSDCEQRAFVLRAVGIEHWVVPEEQGFAVLVDTAHAEDAHMHLVRYEAESRSPLPPVRIALHERAWIGALAYALVLLAIAYFAGEYAFARDWYRAGVLEPRIMHSGEWWRAFTAMTLHADVGHLLGNLAFGTFFGYFAGQLLGPGRAWLSIVLAGTLGNLLNSALMPLSHSSLGASTAVFATLGVVAAYSWRIHRRRSSAWPYRWAPLIAAVALLSFTGSGGERTDVLAHLTGFLAGALIGFAHSLSRLRAAFERVPQWLAGCSALGILLGAWLWGFAAQ